MTKQVAAPGGDHTAHLPLFFVRRIFFCSFPERDTIVLIKMTHFRKVHQEPKEMPGLRQPGNTYRIFPQGTEPFSVLAARLDAGAGQQPKPQAGIAPSDAGHNNITTTPGTWGSPLFSQHTRVYSRTAERSWQRNQHLRQGNMVVIGFPKWGSSLQHLALFR